MSGKIIYEAPRPEARPGETVVTSTCGHNCGGRCVVNAHVVDDKIVKISTDPRRWSPEVAPLLACARGIGQLERVYHSDRLQHPIYSPPTLHPDHHHRTPAYPSPIPAHPKQQKTMACLEKNNKKATNNYETSLKTNDF